MGKAEEWDWLAEFGLLPENIKIRLMEIFKDLCHPLFLLFCKDLPDLIHEPLCNRRKCLVFFPDQIKVGFKLWSERTE